jgi:hypothetical protein
VAVAAKAEDLLGAVGDDGRGEVTCSRRRVWPSSATAVVVGLAAMIFPIAESDSLSAVSTADVPFMIFVLVIRPFWAC